MLVSKIYHFYPTTWTPPIWSIILVWYGAVLPRISQAFSTAFWVSRGTSYALEASLVVHMIIRILFVHQRLGHLILNKGGAQRKGQFVSLLVHIDKLWNVSHSKWGSLKITSKEDISWMGKGTEGIRLEFQTMKYNPDFRQVAKIMLNSVWGNFQGGQDRSVLETAKWEEIFCFPYQFARPDYPYSKPWSSWENAVCIKAQSPTNHSESFSVNSKVSNAGDRTSSNSCSLVTKTIGKRLLQQ